MADQSGQLAPGWCIAVCLFDKSENASNVNMTRAIQLKLPESFSLEYDVAAALYNSRDGDNTRRSSWNGSHGFAEQFWMLRAVPGIGLLLSLFRQDLAIRTSVANFRYLFVAAVNAVDGMTLVIALVRAKHIAVLVIN